MNTAQKIDALFRKFGPTIQIIKKEKKGWFSTIETSVGWLLIKDWGFCWDVTFSTKRESLDRLDGTPTYKTSFFKTNGAATGNMYESTISKWLITDQNRAQEVHELIEARVNEAFNQHCTLTVPSKTVHRSGHKALRG